MQEYTDEDRFEGHVHFAVASSEDVIVLALSYENETRMLGMTPEEASKLAQLLTDAVTHHPKR